MDSRHNTLRRRRGLLVVAAGAVMSVMTATGSSLARVEPGAVGTGGRHGAPGAGDSCGNVLLHRGRFIPLGVPADAAPDPRATVYSGINNRRQLVGGYYVAGRDA